MSGVISLRMKALHNCDMCRRFALHKAIVSLTTVNKHLLHHFAVHCLKEKSTKRQSGQTIRVNQGINLIDLINTH